MLLNFRQDTDEIFETNICYREMFASLFCHSPSWNCLRMMSTLILLNLICCVFGTIKHFLISDRLFNDLIEVEII